MSVICRSFLPTHHKGPYQPTQSSNVPNKHNTTELHFRLVRSIEAVFELISPARLRGGGSGGVDGSGGREVRGGWE